MPSHPDRVRSAPLRTGYQYGDARRPQIAIRFVQQWDWTPARAVANGVLTRAQKAELWRSMCENAAEQLARQAGWNVIEGEEHDAPQPPLSPPPRGLDD